MSPLRRAGVWLNGHPLTACLVLVLVIAVPGYFRVEAIADDATAAAEQATDTADDLEAESARSDLEACQSRADTITVVRQLVTVAYAGGGPAGPFFTSIPGFESLSPEMRYVLTELDKRIAAGGNGGGSEAAKQRALEVLVVPDCTELEAKVDATNTDST